MQDFDVACRSRVMPLHVPCFVLILLSWGPGRIVEHRCLTNADHGTFDD